MSNPFELLSRLWNFSSQAPNEMKIEAEEQDLSVQKSKKVSPQGISDTISSAAAPQPGLAPSAHADSLSVVGKNDPLVQTFSPITAAAPQPVLLTDSNAAILANAGLSIKPAAMKLSEAQEIVQQNYDNVMSTASANTVQTMQTVEAKAQASSTNVQNRLDRHIDDLSSKIDEELKNTTVNFEKLQSMVYKLVMLLMRRTSKADQEFITEMGLQIKAQAVQIQGTYNTWPTLVITLVSAGVSIAGGVMGLAPLAPATYIAVETARTLQGASQAVSTAGTGIQSLSSLSSNKSEGQRQIYQTLLQRMQGKEEDRKGAKQRNGETGKGARDDLKGAAQAEHDAVRTVLETR